MGGAGVILVLSKYIPIPMDGRLKGINCQYVTLNSLQKKKPT